MSDEAKPSDLKGMLKRGSRVSIEEMNDAICEQGAAAGQISFEDCDPVVGNGKAGSKAQPSITDALNDSEGSNIEFEPPKLNIQVRPAKE